MNRLFCLVLALAPFFLALPADAHKRKFSADGEDTQSALLRYLVDEPSPVKKATLLDDFATKYPKHISATWALAELQQIYAKANDFDRAIATGDRILTLDPDDLGIAQENLKIAETAKDPVRIRRAAAVALTIARRLQSAPKPSTPDEIAAWASSADFGKQMETYCDYTFYTLALQTQNPQERIQRMEEFARQSPQSAYAGTLRPQLFAAFQQAGHHARALHLAEEEYRSGGNNEDMLVYAATKAYEKQDRATVTLYAKRVLETLPSKALPPGMKDTEWTRSKQLKLGIAHWMLGVLASKEQRWPDADLHLRAALPLVAQNRDIHAETLYHLGLANFKLGEAKSDTKRLTDAVKFNLLCGGITSTFQQQAKQNAASIRSQFHLQ